MIEPPRCLLVRHGETAWSRDHRHTGRTDLPLLPDGERQARLVGDALAGTRFSLVLTSPLQRAAETCRLAGLAAGAQDDADLVEWDYGAYEGLTTAEIHRDWPGWDLFVDGAPGGERVEDVARRVDRVIDRISAAGGVVACVAHAHVLRVLAARWLGMPPEAGRYLVLGPASTSELGWERGQPVIVRWNLSPGAPST
jgi:broad specificity phosphatase PhoE